MKNIVINHFSQILVRTKDIRVLLPDNIDLKTAKVVLLLHGYCGDYNDWLNLGQAISLAEKYNVVLVMPSGENSFYVNIPGGDRFYDYISKEVVDIVSETFNLENNWYIAGLSMGGYGALLIGLKDERFKYIGSFSAPLDMSKRIKQSSHLNFPVLFRDGITPDIDILKLIDSCPPKPIYLYCGYTDEFYQPNREFASKLESKGLKFTFEGDARGHVWPLWRDALDNYLAIITQDNRPL